MDAAHSLLGLSTKEVTVPRLLLAALASVILYATAKIIYNIFFHPLRSYPGPFLCRVTPLYYVFCEARGNCHLRVKSWHDKYGEVVRAAPNLLLYNSGRAWMKICGHRTAADGGTFDKDQTFFIESPDGTFGIVISPIVLSNYYRPSIEPSKRTDTRDRLLKMVINTADFVV